MPKIKLIKVHSHGVYCDHCDTYTKDTILDEMSPWQEVTDEELKILQSFQGHNILGKNNVSMFILEDITKEETVDGFINDIKKFIKDQSIQEERRKQKAMEADKKRKKLAEQRKIERAKKLLEKTGLKVFDAKE